MNSFNLLAYPVRMGDVGRYVPPHHGKEAPSVHYAQRGMSTGMGGQFLCAH